MKTKLIELINHCTSCEECRDEDIAEHLLDNGVILPPVRYGQTVYAICDLDDEITIEEYSVDGIGYFKNDFRVYHCGVWLKVGSDLCILSKNQAEKALDARLKYGKTFN